jgi:hypothetical protein
MNGKPERLHFNPRAWNVLRDLVETLQQPFGDKLRGSVTIALVRCHNLNPVGANEEPIGVRVSDPNDVLKRTPSDQRNVNPVDVR